MTEVKLNVSPYNDDFNAAKKYLQILALPGRAEQAREFTQIQSILLNVIKKLSGALMAEGNVVDGMGFTFGGTENEIINVNTGKVYLDGVIHDFDGDSVTLSKVGEENIGVRLIKSIVTEDDDSSLTDPADGFANFARAGAHRLKAEVELVLNDPTLPTIYRFFDGELQKDDVKPQLEIVNQLLARRTFDESGNYKVSGLELWTKDIDSSNILLTVESGKAYVQGFEINKPSPTRIVLPKSLETRSVTSEPKTFLTGTSLYKLNNKPVKSISKVTATVATSDNVTRGSSSGGSDFLPKAPVSSIDTVVAGGTTYVQGTDFQLSGDSVDWSLAGAEPSIGSTYTVTYKYTKVMVDTTDYTLTPQNGEFYLDFTPAGSDPVNNTVVSIDYSYYLARHDRVYLSNDGTVTVVSGQSDRKELAKAPEDSDLFRLSLGNVKLEPQSADTVVQNTAVTRVSMTELHNMLQRIDNIEYNQALDSLDQEALASEQATNLKGIFTDGFIGFTKADLSHPAYSAGIDVTKFELVQGAIQNVYKPVVNAASSIGLKRFKNDAFFSLGYTENTAITQVLTTGTINVNPYQAFGKTPSQWIWPTRDNWVDTTSIRINNVQTSYNFVIGSWRGKPTQWVDLGSTTRVFESLLPFARPIEVAVSGVNFPDNWQVEGYIDGVKVSLTPTGTTQVGASGNVLSDSVGAFDAKFTIPSGVRTGSREVLLKAGVVQATSIFTSQGINRREETTVLSRRIITQVYDPLAQSFQLPDSRFVSSVDVYFSNKSSTQDVVVQIRNMVNGTPGNEVLGEKRLSPNQVNVDVNGNAITKVSFDTPVFCERDNQYCFVVATDSRDYALHFAKMGNKQLVGSSIVGQPYLAGVMFSSSNALTWTPHQDSDLKFNINVAEFASSGTVEFNYINSIDVDSLALLADFDTLEGTNVSWEYRSSVSGAWLPIDTYNTKILNSTSTVVALRAKLNTTNSNLSPVLSGESLNLIGLTTSLSSSYISRLVTTSQNYTNVTQIIEAYVPSGTTVQVQLSTNDSTWVTGTLSLTEQIDSEFARYTYTYTIPAAGVSTKFRARINLLATNRVVQPRVRKLMNIIK